MRKSVLSAAFAVAVWTAGTAAAPGQQAGEVSRPGEYGGLTAPVYDDWVRTSRYVEVRDGTRLAVDVLRPAVAGEPVEEPLPVVWAFHRYQRAMAREGRVIDIATQYPYLERLLRHGYVVAAVDVRGGGASFGTSLGIFHPQEARDAYDLTEWFARQPWSDGNIGMFGGSYLGGTQFLAAGFAPPHLKAIFPQKAPLDLYGALRPGGVLVENFLLNWARLTRQLDVEVPAAPVTGDSGEALLAMAVEQHKDNVDPYELYGSVGLRDGQTMRLAWPYLVGSPHSYAPALRDSDVAVYLMGGWFDTIARGTALWYRNLGDRTRLVMGPWFHQQSEGLDLGAEHLRWFDRWLKGVRNGIDREPPVRYHVMGESGDAAWRSASDWPPPEARPDTLYFAPGPTGTIASLHDGMLGDSAPPAPEAVDRARFDSTATSGKPSRWSNTYGDGGIDVAYPDMRPNDRRGFTYTTAPLDRKVVTAGHPVVELWVESTAPDGDFFVYLEEVTPDGRSTYLSEGVLRASHRRTTAPPYDKAGLPYHRSFARDTASLRPGRVHHLAIDLQPVANLFEPGHRIRVTITGADRDNFRTPALGKPPIVGIHRDASHASLLVLPVLPE